MPRSLSRPPVFLTLLLSLLLALTLTSLHPSASSHLEPLHQHLNAALAPMQSAFDEKVRPKLREVVDVYWAGSGSKMQEGDLGDRLSHVVFSPLHASHPRPPHASTKKLPTCSRSFIYRLHGSRPFAEEVLRMTRSIAVAEKLGYNAFVRSEGWKWGEWEDYFLQPTANCSLDGTPKWIERKGMHPLFGAEVVAEVSAAVDSSADDEEPQEEDEKVEDYASPSWSNEDHICDGTSDAYLTPLFLSHFTSPIRLHRLHQLELSSYPPPLPLDAGETLQSELGEAWRAMRGVLERWWVLNEEMRALVEAGVEMEWEREEREVVGVVVGLSDGCLEETESKYSPLRLLTPIQLSRYRRRYPSPACSTSPSSSPSLTPSLTQTYLAAISRALSTSPTSEASLLSEPVVAIVLSSAEGEAEGEVSGKQGGTVLEQLQRGSAGRRHEHEDEGNAEMLLLAGLGEEEGKKGKTDGEERVRRMKGVLRRWTILSEKTDSMVVSETSEVGRLLTLLAGPDMLKAGRVISVDVRWFPGTYYS